MTFYYFVNVTQNLNDVAEKTDIRNIGILSLFESVIQANNWNSNDAIMAFPENQEDDHPVIKYVNGDFEFKFKCDECDSIDEDSCGCNKIDEDSYGCNAEEIDEDEIKHENCTYCGVKLRNYTYGNICGKHIPSYALWDNPEDYNSNYSSFYEELCERKLAIELDEYDYGQDYGQYERSDIDDGYGYECEGMEESCY